MSYSSWFWKRALTLALVVIASRTEASLLYWVDPTADEVQRADLDGGAVTTLISGQFPPGYPSGLITPIKIKLDMDRGKMYLLDEGRSKVARANLDGTGLETVLESTPAVPFVSPKGLTLDLVHGRLYVAAQDDIVMANLDGTGAITIIENLEAGLRGLAVEPIYGSLYWTADKQNQNVIQRSDLYGMNIETLVSGLASPSSWGLESLALDVSANKMYWTDKDAGSVQRANLDGSGIEDIVTGLSAPLGLALDRQRGHVYWSDWAANNTSKIQRSGLDGTNIEDVFVSLDSPRGLAIESTAIPEPAALAIWSLLGFAGAGFITWRRRRK